MITNKNYLEKKIITPKKIKSKYKLNLKNKLKIINNKNTISDIINKKNNKFLIICGPCSISDYKSSIEYGKKLYNLYKKVKNYIYIVMRTYLEKPRTSIGWKGIINDPYINNTNKIEDGIIISRKILVDLIKINIPIGTELLNPIYFKYFDDLFSWISIGARTSESQIHREIVSSLDIPTGFKNSLDGTINSSINSIKSSSTKHTFISIKDDGKICLLDSNGNNNTHIILRGGKNGPNYYSDKINSYIDILKKENLNKSIIIDCSHDNSYKNYKLQKKVSDNIIEQKINGNEYISGIMLESNLFEGNQYCNSLNNLKFGISITDSCIGWDETEYIINNIYKKLKKINKK
ncbi:phospho-2-dehydro-3-deoxyheptonate aldolase [endosymbiont of Euscepes postfasciatus]|uniref:3-deoxy-7-phosphoheptulonate synthase n=1 Tax=endosymbiont of Euscepes postfasciatus TaxID=650377 RepID=UPI000DC6E9E1|nr:3-deoxy-7-phosphoheptulonate synthase [endosymbiont of Euscepes postfasciatus]BBA84649.1 phospho-2-dehydro-3-deoxyheptonate aldolase [endosymbiont of Euscepes postfasciatus]